MSANVSIITNKSEDVLCAPNTALKYTPETEGQKYEKQGVWILDKNKPKRVDITQGASDDSKFEVISAGIKEGDLVLTGSSKASDKSGNKRRPPRMF